MRRFHKDGMILRDCTNGIPDFHAGDDGRIELEWEPDPWWIAVRRWIGHWDRDDTWAAVLTGCGIALLGVLWWVGP